MLFFTATRFGRIVSVTGSLLASSAALPQAGAAQWTHWEHQCTPGAVQACASLSLGTFYDAMTDRTRVSTGVSNLQGFEPWIPNPGRYVIPFVTFTNIETTWTGFPRPGSFTLGPGSGIDLIGPGDIDGYFGELYGDRENLTISHNPQQGAAGVWGCAGAPPGALLSWRPYTCGGTLYHTFDLPGEWWPSAITSASFRALAWNDEGQVQSIGCTVGLDCMTVTPEPSTWVMLATGLLALGFAMRRRRRGMGPC